MELHTLHMAFWLVGAITHTSHALVELSVTPQVTVACGEGVTLLCNVSSSQDDLLIMHLGWMRYNAPSVRKGQRHSLCDVSCEGDSSTVKHHGKTLSSFDCNYTQDFLALTIHRVLPMDEGVYMCKLRSNKGIKEAFTRVSLQECSGEVDIRASAEEVTCTFKGVHPEGEVHWFHGSINVTEGPLKIINHAHMDVAWPAITSTLQIGGAESQLQDSLNCSLWSPRSGRYITSRLVEVPVVEVHRQTGYVARSGVRSPQALWTLFEAALIFAILVNY